MLAGKIADAATQGQACDAGGSHNPASGSESEGMGGVVEICPGCSRLGTGRTGVGVNTDPGTVDEIYDKGIVPGPETGALWPPPRIANGRELSRAKFTLAMTSATWATRTTPAGRLSIIPLKTARAES